MSSVRDYLDTIGSPVVKRIEKLFDDEKQKWGFLDSSVANVLDALKVFILNGGKRLRPAFCYWTFVGFGGNPKDEKIIDLAAALEMLHSFALIHDDVMDGATTRRGMKSMHSYHEKMHREMDFFGETRRFGEGVAILIGDMASAYVDLLLKNMPTGITDIFNDVRIELNVGQFLDVFKSAERSLSLDMSEHIARYKSGKYTVERPIQLGAALAGCFDENAELLMCYSKPIGEAFQFRDDLLGVFGDQKVIGKPVGADILEGKITQLAAITFDRLSEDEAEFFVSKYGSKDLSETNVSKLQDLIVSSGAKEELENKINLLVKSGIEALHSVPLQKKSIKVLEELAYFISGRSH